MILRKEYLKEIFDVHKTELLSLGRPISEPAESALLDWIETIIRRRDANYEDNRDKIIEDFKKLKNDIIATIYPNDTYSVPSESNNTVSFKPVERKLNDEVTLERIILVWKSISESIDIYDKLINAAATPIKRNAQAQFFSQVTEALSRRDYRAEELQAQQSYSQEAVLAYYKIHKVALINKTLVEFEKALTKFNTQAETAIMEEFRKAERDIYKKSDDIAIAYDLAHQEQNFTY